MNVVKNQSGDYVILGKNFDLELKGFDFQFSENVYSIYQKIDLKKRIIYLEELIEDINDRKDNYPINNLNNYTNCLQLKLFDKDLTLRPYLELMDWNPILYKNDDNEAEGICLNINKNSPDYMKLALLSYGDHYWTSVFIISENIEKFIPDLEKEINNYKEKLENNELKGWDLFYNTPIKELIKKIGGDVTF
jgi:hypothetical protein